MQQQGVRRLFVISGDADWCRQQARLLGQSLPGDWQWISEMETQVSAIPAIAAKKLLGQEKMHAVFDATMALNVEALAILAGTLRAGSWLLLLVPKWRLWPQLTDKDSLRWSEQHDPLATPNFINHFQQQLLVDKEIAFWHQGHPSFIPRMQTRPEHRWQDGMPTSEQQTILHRLMRAKRGVWVLTAARGRGKSTLAGMLIAQWQGICWITAPSKATTEVLCQQIRCQKTDKPVVFWAPDALLNFCRQYSVSQVDWLLIDEAAAIPIPLLSSLLKYFPRILLTTTIQGYEGTGRGFLLKFCANLTQWHHLILTDPIRWAVDDPLERFLNQTLLFNDPPPTVVNSSVSVQILSCQQHEWRLKPHLLRCFYGLLSSAHYRTTPLDLRRLMDAPGMHFTTAFAAGSLIGAIWLVEEGGLDSQLARDIWAGRRRPRGNLVAQSLAAHSGQWLAPTLRSRRVSRIAVTAIWRRQGIANRMIQEEKESALQQKRDFLSVSFGYNDELNSFWQACGFKLLRIGDRKEASSGCYTAMAILPLSKAGEILCQSAQQQLARDGAWLQAWLQPSLQPQQEYFLQQGKIDQSLNDDDWRELAGFAYAYRSLATSLAALQRLLLSSPLPLPMLRQHLQQRLSTMEVVASRNLSGRKALMLLWRQEVQQALLALDKARSDIWKAWAIDTSYL
ncbi:GNAT family N-acetyltransferase [Candidatus Fukatsuia symbiotica]|uniref:tRNA(Met) cytidine acetyltransferase TmcA n=1 Tax=Candidatus Fukatsuia symbiotica TaxID=1878942 RepID=A0A2Y9CKE1_9GAMM|nr:GNAT family N-acetyltransferase [Candidatus Fukatsuia symbiotica]AWK15359.1 tRNA(Met) cytidine acetyltransferase [Candidatus Fukatsuia symbiotica]MEA9444512.1 GNAT family N-acetyltransferase [Candidatus Fukatsuia symbiotica]